MKKVCMSGFCLCEGSVGGFAVGPLELVRGIDSQLSTGKWPLDVELCYPASKQIHSIELNNIRAVPLDGDDKRFTCSLRKYAKHSNAVYCGLAQNYAVTRNQISWIHDIRPLDVKGYDSKKSYINQVLLKYTYWIHKARVITCSEYTKDSLLRLWGRSFSDRITVAGNGWDHILRITDDEDVFERYPQIVKNKYYYSIGSVMRHKNYEWILKAAEHNPDDQFVIAGATTNGYTILSDAKLPSNVIFVGRINDGENKALMTKCKAFVHPSLYEGFGLPPMEALGLGKEIIISTATSLPGIYGNCAHYLDPYNPIVKMDELLQLPVEPPNLLLEKYTWSNVASIWLDLIEKV